MTDIPGNDRSTSDKKNWAPLREEAEALAATLPPLLVAAERLASAVSLGVHGRRKAGMGETFWQFRRYSNEDPSVLIDWRQSAKSQNLYVREREWEAAEAVWLWRDGSAGMRYGSTKGGPTKIERANLLTLALGSLLVRGGERIGLLGDGRAPATGRAPLRRIAHELLNMAPRDETRPPDAPATKNSQLVWFGDFLASLGEIEESLQRFSGAGLSGHLVHIIDPAEEDFPFAGRTRFESPARQEMRVFGRAESVQAPYRARFRAHAEAVSAVGRRLGWSYIAHRTDKRPEVALVALYSQIGDVPMKRHA